MPEVNKIQSSTNLIGNYLKQSKQETEKPPLQAENQAEINTETKVEPAAQPKTQVQPQEQKTAAPASDVIDLSTQGDNLKKFYVDGRMGAVAWAYNKLKNLTGIGVGSKKANLMIDEFKKGNVSKEKTVKYLKDYKYSQRDSNELAADILTGVVSFAAFRKIKTLGHIGALFSKNAKPISMAAGGFIAAGIGAFIKPFFKWLNSLGADKKTRRQERTRWRDFFSGAVTGGLAPIALIGNKFITMPLVLAGNAISRYTFTKRGDDKSFKDFIHQQFANPELKIIGAALMAYKGMRGRINIHSWDEAVANAKKNVANLQQIHLPEKTSEFQALVDKIGLMEDGKIAEIMQNTSLSTVEKMREFEKYNLFIPKYLQTIPDNVLKDVAPELSEIVTRFKSDCPVSRTVEQAQEILTKTFGDKYSIIGDKALGTGTVAETYLVKAKDGKEYVIKMIKDGMSAEKIEKDRVAILEMIRNSGIKDSKELEFAEKNVNTLFDAWKKEVDLKLESDAAELLGSNAKNYNCVKSIEVKDNMYVMEKAPGVQFNKLVESLEKEGKKITEKEFFTLIMNYYKVFFEQLLSVPKHGSKVMHADPHPGNVFIDLANKEKPFTFIDTGNVLRYTPEQAITNTLNHLDYLIGNSEAIAKSLLRDAKLPKGMSDKQAVDIVTKALNEKIYNKKSALPMPPFRKINDFCMDVMTQNQIIPNPNNTNLMKAEATYFNNLSSLDKIWDHFDDKTGRLEGKEAMDDVQRQAKLLLKEMGDSIANSAINNKRHTLKELRSRQKFVEENKEQFLSTIYGLVHKIKDID